jgi:riboflavin transporter FmnP
VATSPKTPRGFTLYCYGLGFVALATAAVLALTTPLPDPLPLILLGALFAIAENRVVMLPNNAMSASFMLGMAAVVVFASSGAILGPLVVGMCGALYLPHLRERQWTLVMFNVGNLGLSCLAAAGVYAVIPSNVTASVFGQLLAAVPAGLTYSLLNYTFLVPAVAMRSNSPLSEVAAELWLGDLQIYPFALLGVLLGRVYLSQGAWVVPLFVAPIFIARQAFASYIQLRAQQESTLSTLVRALEAKDRYTAGHVERVAKFADYMGRGLEMKPVELERLRYVALMHDIGKLIVPNQILNKPGKLTEEEFERMRRHEHVSVELLRRIDFLAPVAPSLEAEAAKGSGADPNTPIEARIVTVADAFDAMTSTRAYRRALTQEVAFQELRDKAGIQFDATCVEALIAAIEARGERYGSGHEVDIADFATPPPVVGTGSAGLGDLASEQHGAR